MSEMIRLDWMVTGLVILAAFAVIFMVGVTAQASGMVPWPEDASGLPSQSSAAQQSLPRSDTPGRDMQNVERYPESVRVKYERYDLVEAEVVEVGYLTNSELEDVSGFYEELPEQDGWRTAGSDVSLGDEIGILITKGNGEDMRRVLIEIEPRGELVSVDLEETVADSL